MLDHLQCQHDIEPLALARQVLGCGAAISQVEILAARMKLGDAHQFLRSIDAGHCGAKTRQRLRRETAAAADVDQR